MIHSSQDLLNNPAYSNPGIVSFAQLACINHVENVVEVAGAAVLCEDWVRAGFLTVQLLVIAS